MNFLTFYFNSNQNKLNTLFEKNYLKLLVLILGCLVLFMSGCSRAEKDQKESSSMTFKFPAQMKLQSGSGTKVSFNHLCFAVSYFSERSPQNPQDIQSCKPAMGIVVGTVKPGEAISLSDLPVAPTHFEIFGFLRDKVDAPCPEINQGMAQDNSRISMKKLYKLTNPMLLELKAGSDNTLDVELILPEHNEHLMAQLGMPSSCSSDGSSPQTRSAGNFVKSSSVLAGQSHRMYARISDLRSKQSLIGSSFQIKQKVASSK
jgi:hypothetical protein